MQILFLDRMLFLIICIVGKSDTLETAGVEFVLLSGVPERYIQLFDLLRLRKGAVVVADNALDDATNDYIRHVRRQPGVESSTLPLNRGIEVTKIVCWEDFQRGYVCQMLSFRFLCIF